MKNQQFLKYPDNRYIATTGESPPGMANMAVAFAGDTPAEVKETVIAIANLPGEIVTDVPDDWKAAFEAAGFEFEVVVVRSALEDNIDELKMQIEYEILSAQLVAIRGVEPVYTSRQSFTVPFWSMVLCGLGGFSFFCSLVLAL